MEEKVIITAKMIQAGENVLQKAEEDPSMSRWEIAAEMFCAMRDAQDAQDAPQ